MPISLGSVASMEGCESAMTATTTARMRTAMRVWTVNQIASPAQVARGFVRTNLQTLQSCEQLYGSLARIYIVNAWEAACGTKVGTLRIKECCLKGFSAVDDAVSCGWTPVCGAS